MSFSALMSKAKSVYDRILAFSAVALLIGSLMYLAVRMGMDRSEDARWRKTVEEMKPRCPSARVISSNVFGKAMISLEQPLQIQYTNWSWKLVVPEPRVACIDCPVSIPFDAANCYRCGATNYDKGDDPTVDTDADGMEDKWEIRYGLDPNDSSDAKLDLDNDGFANLLERKYETDPADDKSFPPYEAWLAVKEIKADQFRLLFKSHVNLQDGSKRFGINPRAGGKTYFVKLGEAVDGFTLVTFRTNIVDKTVGNNMTIREDVSELDLRRGEKLITLIKNKDVIWDEYKASLLFQLDEQVFNVVKDQAFNFKGNEYLVILIDKDKSIVVIKRTSDGKEFTVTSLGESGGMSITAGRPKELQGAEN